MAEQKAEQKLDVKALTQALTQTLGWAERARKESQSLDEVEKATRVILDALENLKEPEARRNKIWAEVVALEERKLLLIRENEAWESGTQDWKKAYEQGQAKHEEGKAARRREITALEAEKTSLQAEVDALRAEKTARQEEMRPASLREAQKWAATRGV